MLTLIGVVGGLAIFLYGMQIAGDSLQVAAGSRFKKTVKFLTRNRLMGILIGCLITFLLQSSSATTVLLVGFVSASLMNLSQTIGVLLGAHLGSTLTVQLIALNFSGYALAMVAIGFAMRTLKNKPHLKDVGGVILGFGFVFFGMKVMSDAMIPLRTDPGFQMLLANFSQYPLLATVAAAGFTAIIQSSAATLGLALSLASQGLMPLEAAIPIIFGSHIGTMVTAILSSIGASQEAKRVAAVHCILRVLGVLIMFPFIGYITTLTQLIGGDPTRQIANVHTILNVGWLIVFMPFTHQIALLADRLVPNKKEEGVGVPKFITAQALDTPVIAIEQANLEVIRVGRLIQTMSSQVLDTVLSKNPLKLSELGGLEVAIDRLAIDITHYLSDLSQKTMDSASAQKVINLLFIINDLEHMGDRFEKMLRKGYQIRREDLQFSQEGLEELQSMHETVTEMVELTMDALEHGNWEKARTVALEQPYIIMDEWKYRKTHICRLQQGVQDSRDTSAIHLDLLDNMQRICEHSRNICQVLLHEAGELYDLFHIFDDEEEAVNRP